MEIKVYILISDQGWRSKGLNQYSGTQLPCHACTKRVIIQWTWKTRKVQQYKNGVTGCELQWVKMGSRKKLLPSLNTDNVILRSSQVESLNCNDSQVRSY